MVWQQIRIRTDDTNVDAIEAHCIDLGAVAITLEDAGDAPLLEPAPGETPLWQELTLTAMFDADANTDALCSTLEGHGVERAAMACETVAERDWQNEWLRDFAARNVGPRLRIVGSHQHEPDDDRIRIVLDPGLAFGTGGHTTTELALEWLQQESVAGCHVLDMGCGSGILAIAALKLGAASACGVDIDPQAVDASVRNAEINGVAARLRTHLGAAAPEQPYDVVVANILANTLDEMAPALATRTRPQGRIALTGVLPAQADALAARYDEWFDMAPIEQRAGWVLLSGRRR
ncbi:MAG: 50S ribosomal protein L11 methyltransferase [Pseudomonadota bacterium]